MFRNKSVNAHQFSMIPKADIPRSSFNMQKTYKTTFDSGYLIPIYCEEILPGDTFNTKMTAFCRLATPIFPIMDNMYLETFFFFVPCRLVWFNWQRFMGEQHDPGDSIDYTIPQLTSPAGGFPVNSIYDYFGLPTVGQVQGGQTVAVNSLPLRAYNLIFNEWFRDENLVDSQNVILTDGGEDPALYELMRRGKRHDYFTSCLPWTQKGDPVQLPLGSSAPVTITPFPFVGAAPTFLNPDASSAGTLRRSAVGAATAVNIQNAGPGVGAAGVLAWDNPALAGVADLSAATAATINQIRQAFQIQKLLERDARGGTRYTEIIRSHFGVISPDARLQRPEYLGGGKTAIAVNPIAQTSATGVTGGTSAMGTLSAMGTALARNHGFSQSFTEHGYVIGLCHVGADLTYQQGLRKMWSRQTRYDFYFPVFAALGEQAVLNKEIYCRGDANDSLVFGYQERWAEYRYNPSQITGLFRSTSAGTIDPWHLSQRFTSLPTLDTTFIQDTPPLSRILAVGDAANGKQLLMDAFFETRAARPMPMYSVPGLVDHF